MTAEALLEEVARVREQVETARAAANYIAAFEALTPLARAISAFLEANRVEGDERALRAVAAARDVILSMADLSKLERGGPRG